nr:hypothetical protein [Catellatospora sichuanensis]
MGNFPDRDARLNRIEEILDRFPQRVFAFDEFGPFGIRPTAGELGRAGTPTTAAGRPPPHPRCPLRPRLPLGRREDTLWVINRCRKGTTNTLAALKSICAARPDGGVTYVILDNLSAAQGRTDPALGPQAPG